LPAFYVRPEQLLEHLPHFLQPYGDWSYTHKDFVMPEENVMIVSVDKEAEEKKEAELAKQAEENAANAPKVATNFSPIKRA